MPELQHCNKIRKHINWAFYRFMPTVDGVSYCHVDLEGYLPVFFYSDIHLSDVALDIFNLGLQSCVELASVQVGCQAQYM